MAEPAKQRGEDGANRLQELPVVPDLRRDDPRSNKNGKYRGKNFSAGTHRENYNTPTLRQRADNCPADAL